MRDTTTRVLLWLLVIEAAVLGVWATVAPQSFYDDFPGGGRHWVSADGPYNEHLVRDVGALSLALAVVVLAAALRPSRFNVRVAALAALVYAAPHFTYHLFHLDLFDSADQVAQTVSLAITVAVPVVLLVRTMRPERTAAAQGPEPAWR